MTNNNINNNHQSSGDFSKEWMEKSLIANVHDNFKFIIYYLMTNKNISPQDLNKIIRNDKYFLSVSLFELKKINFCKNYSLYELSFFFTEMNKQISSYNIEIRFYEMEFDNPIYVVNRFLYSFNTKTLCDDDKLININTWKRATYRKGIVYEINGINHKYIPGLFLNEEYFNIYSDKLIGYL